MHIKIVGFKCHLDVSYNFSDGSMVLLKGDSGAGKSTIMQAIYWCLYGSMRGIYNNTGLIKTCSVTIKINNWIIYRQKRPEVLKLTIDNNNNSNNNSGTENTYQDKIAQDLINERFGSKELWKSCSYIGQKERCFLLSSSAYEKLNLLNQLSFGDDDPKKYIKGIDNELKNAKSEYDKLQASFDAELKLFTEKLTLKPVIPINHTLDNISKYIGILENKKKELYSKLLEQEKNRGIIETLKLQLDNDKKSLSSIPVTNITETFYSSEMEKYNLEKENIRKNIANVQHWNELSLKRNNIINNINRLENIVKSLNDEILKLESSIFSIEDSVKSFQNNNINDETVWKVRQKEQEKDKHISMLKEFGLEYNPSEIQTYIQKLEWENYYHSLYLEKRNKICKLEETKKRLIDLEKSLPNGLRGDEENIKELETLSNNMLLEISNLRKGLETLQCPKCSSSLRFLNNKLVSSDNKPTNPNDIKDKENRRNRLLELISKIRTINNIKQEMMALENEIKSMNIPNGIDLDNFGNVDPNLNHQKIYTLKGVNIIPEITYSSNFLKKVLEYRKNNNSLNELRIAKNNNEAELNKYKDELKNCPDLEENKDGNVLNELHTQYNNLENKCRELYFNYEQQSKNKKMANDLKNKIKTTKEKIETLQNLISNDLKPEYEKTSNDLEKWIELREKTIYSIDMMEKRKELECKRQKVVALSGNIKSLAFLKQKAVEIECQQLQETVGNINATLDNILPLFFDEPIEVKLSLYKILKTKKKVKPGLNMVIKYKGVEYDNINMLSGGEGDRISLALVIALSNVSNSPIIMLDECISSLDANLKECCIESMKKLHNKTILCIDHEGVEGYYDKTITVSH